MLLVCRAEALPQMIALQGCSPASDEHVGRASALQNENMGAGLQPFAGLKQPTALTASSGGAPAP